MVLTVFSRLTLTIQTPIPVGFKRIWASLPPARLPTKSIGVGTTRPHIRPPPRPPGPSGLPSSDLPPVPGLQAVAPPGVAFAHVPTLSITLLPVTRLPTKSGVRPSSGAARLAGGGCWANSIQLPRTGGLRPGDWGGDGSSPHPATASSPPALRVCHPAISPLCPACSLGLHPA